MRAKNVTASDRKQYVTYKEELILLDVCSKFQISGRGQRPAAVSRITAATAAATVKTVAQSVQAVSTSVKHNVNYLKVTIDLTKEKDPRVEVRSACTFIAHLNLMVSPLLNQNGRRVPAARLGLQIRFVISVPPPEPRTRLRRNPRRRPKPAARAKRTLTSTTSSRVTRSNLWTPGMNGGAIIY